MKQIAILLFSMFVFALSFLNAQNNPYEIIEQIKAKYNLLNDYEADAIIKIDVNFLKAPESKAKIYFKKPDKIKLKSEGFALLPKEGLNFLPAKLLKGDITAIPSGSEVIDGEELTIIKIIPGNDSSGVVLSKLWIDENNSVIKKVETTTKQRGSFTVLLFYSKQLKYGLPDSVRLSFNINNVQMPNSMMGAAENKPKRRKRFSGPMVGAVSVRYYNYKVNVGLSDELFEKEKFQK